MTCFSHRNHRDECHGTDDQTESLTDKSAFIILCCHWQPKSAFRDVQLFRCKFWQTHELSVCARAGDHSRGDHRSQCGRTVGDDVPVSVPQSQTEARSSTETQTQPQEGPRIRTRYTHTHTLCVVKNIFTKLLGDFLKTVLKRTSGCWLSNTRASVFVACSSPCVD